MRLLALACLAALLVGTAHGLNVWQITDIHYDSGYVVRCAARHSSWV